MAWLDKEGLITARGMLKISAIILGVFLALWFLRGDMSADDTFSARVKVEEEDSVSFSDIKVFNVTFQNGTKITIMGSPQAPLIGFLTNTTKDVVIEVHPRSLAVLHKD